MSTLARAGLIGGLLTVVSAVGRADFELPLQLRPRGGRVATRVVSNGVPLLPGQAKDTKELHVLGPDGVEVPAQFRVLARWWRNDDSIRWVLVSFIRSDEEGPRPAYKLVGRKRPAAPPKTGMTVTEDGDVIRVNTGAAAFEISRKRFNLLNKVQVSGQTVVHPHLKLGSVTEDPDGRKYYSSLGTQSVRVLERGPVMVRVLAKGRHVSAEKGAFKPGLYGYEISMTFWAGKAFCDVDAVLTNNSLKPIGEPHFEDWSLMTRIGKGGAGIFAALGGKKTRVDGAALLYQDSVGTDGWKEALGVGIKGGRNAPKPDIATFRGYKLFKRAGGNRQELERGDFADGLADCAVGDIGCAVSPRYFWQQFPSALEFGDGVIRLAPFPREYKSVHWLEDATAKAQEFRLCFYTKDGAAAREAARRYQTRVFALPSPEHCGRAGALSDLGPYMMHDKNRAFAGKDVYFSLAKVERGLLHPRANGFGWQVFGMRWFEMAGHSPWNYEPLGSSGSLWTHLLNAKDDRLEWGMRVARHARDVRAYYIDGQDNLALWKKWRPDYWENCVIEHFSRLVKGAISRPKVKHPDLAKHPYRRHRWPLPNMSHLNLDEVYDLYLMTGDDRALRCMRTIADHGIAWVLLRPGKRQVYRDEGWCMRTLMRYYELTGDPRYEPYVRKVIDRIWRDVNKAGPITGRGGTWYQAIYARGCITAWRATGDERMRDLALGCADWGMTYEVTTKGYPAPGKPKPWLLTPEQRVGPKWQRGMCPPWANGYHIDLYAWAYQQTGDKKYLDAMDFAWKMNRNTWWLGYFPCAMYMAYGPRSDTTPPAAIADLKAEAGKGQASLSWTAPGDDGMKATAGVYQIKYATKPILDFVTWPDKRETHINFWGAVNVSDEPAPKAAGTRQTYTVKGLKPGTYYFAAKSRDECSNQSPISNIATAEVK